MQTEPRNSGDLSQDSVPAIAHQSSVTPLTKSVIDPSARTSKSAYRNLNSASVGLELGLSVIIGLVLGYYLDRELGTSPWLMLMFLGFGFVAGFRGVLRAVRREDRQAIHG
jgi:F0F1-type ATP synthase assembly protein I